MIRVHPHDPEVPGGPAGPGLVDVAACDELADLAVLGELADRAARLRRVETASRKLGYRFWMAWLPQPITAIRASRAIGAILSPCARASQWTQRWVGPPVGGVCVVVPQGEFRVGLNRERAAGSPPR